METEVETERLLLRVWRPDDLDQLADVFSQEPVWGYPFKRGWTFEETEDFLSRKIDVWHHRCFSQWAVEVKAEAQLIGFLGLASSSPR
ncbi:MAG: GNAT family N-acetyltransferase [Acidimicrobiales bacterium]